MKAKMHCSICSTGMVLANVHLNAYACRPCGTIRLVPPPDDEELVSLYDRDYYASWGEADGQDGYWSLKLALFRRVMDEVGPLPAGSLALDVGCATGGGLAVFRERGLEPVGIDINPYAINVARQRVPDAAVYHSPLEHAPLSEGTFNLILLSDVIEHVRDTVAFLSHIKRLLAPTGRVAIITPDAGSLSARIMGAYWPHLKREHLLLFERRAIVTLFAQAGLRVRSVRPIAKPLSLAYAARQFSTYPLPLLSPLLRMMVRAVPPALSAKAISVPMGEMIVVGERISYSSVS